MLALEWGPRPAPPHRPSSHLKDRELNIHLARGRRGVSLMIQPRGLAESRALVTSVTRAIHHRMALHLKLAVLITDSDGNRARLPITVTVS
jgi:hypothetical protein